MLEHDFNRLPQIAEENTKPNLLAALIGSTSGAIMAVLIWSAVTAWQPGTFFIAMPLLIGGFAGGAAQLFTGSTARIVGAIAVLVALVALVLGDFSETMVAAQEYSRYLTIGEYGEILVEKVTDNPLRALVYLATPLVAYASAVTQGRNR